MTHNIEFDKNGLLINHLPDTVLPMDTLILKEKKINSDHKEPLTHKDKRTLLRMC